jgi:hypothetical protein
MPQGSTGNGGQINIKGNTIALADTSKIKANAKEQGNGGQIIVLSAEEDPGLRHARSHGW